MRDLAPDVKRTLDETECADLAEFVAELKGAKRDVREIRADIRKIRDRARKRAERENRSV